jgi:hypothetical protein
MQDADSMERDFLDKLRDESSIDYKDSYSYTSAD